MLFERKPIVIGSLKDVLQCKRDFPGASLKDVERTLKGRKYNEVLECRKYFNNASLEDIDIILKSRSFIRWTTKNRKVITAITLAVPAFTATMSGLSPTMILDLFTTPLADPTSIVALGAPAGSTIPAVPNAVASFAPTVGAAKVETNFFGNKGAILLHMLVVGFFTLVVSSFLKFTGRGDIIPLVAFVGGGIVLYEVIGLFNDIYGAIKTLLQM